MIIVQGCPFDLEIWSFFHDFIENTNLSDSVEDGEPLFQDSSLSNLNKTYAYFSDIFDCASNIGTKKVNYGMNRETVVNEVQSVIERVMYYCVQETLPLDVLNNFTEDFCGEKCLNHRFRVNVFYKIQQINLRLTEISFDKIPPIILREKENREEITQEYYNQIKLSCKGDLYEFVEYVKIDIARRAVDKPHETISKIEKYFRFDNDDFAQTTDASDVHRMIWLNYFDKFEKNFSDFFAAFQNECIFYFLKDFLSLEIEIVPFYRIYSYKNQIYDSPADIFEKNELRKLIDEKKLKFQV